MADRIKEAEIETMEWRRYDEFLLAAPGEEGTGIPVFQLRALAPTYDEMTEALAIPHRQLVIEVEDPDGAATIDRVRTAITARLRVR